MSHQTESILKSAIERFRSMSPAERRDAIRAAANRAKQVAVRGRRAADVRLWDLGGHHVFGVSATRCESTCIRVPSTEPSTVTVTQAGAWSPAAFGTQVFAATQVPSTTGVISANNNIEYMPTNDLVVAA